ncbi:MAG: fasciclin domain-containing protein [Acidimicrobiia bacterium]
MLTPFKKLVLATALVASVLTLSVGTSAAQDPEAPSIAEVATEDGRFSTLVTALGAAGLADMFADCEGGPYTVLAPTDDAFTAALSALGIEVGDLVADTATLTSILTYHVIDGAVPSDVVVTLDGQTAPTVQGEEIGVTVSGDNISITSGNPTPANVIVADVQACNGIIHAIDNVLLPPTVAEALTAAAEEGAAEEDAAAEEEAATTAEEGEAELANTGAATDMMVVAAVALLAVGAGAVFTGRRLRLND